MATVLLYVFRAFCCSGEMILQAQIRKEFDSSPVYGMIALKIRQAGSHHLDPLLRKTVMNAITDAPYLLFFAYHTKADVGISDRRFACFFLLFRSATGSWGFPRTTFDRFGVGLAVRGSPLPNIAPHVNRTTSRECF